MRCGCPHCGAYMVQKERGLESACACPGCLHTCNACMGTAEAPIGRMELIQKMQLLSQYEEDSSKND